MSIAQNMKNQNIDLDLVNTKKQVRKQMRAKRKNLSFAEQKTASLFLAKNLDSFIKFKKWKNFAVYLASDGEINLDFWIKKYNKKILKKSYKNKQTHKNICKKKVYLPIVHRFNQGKLLFGEFNNNSKLYKNRFKIKQPHLKQGLKFNWLKLDVIFLPLVAFDAKYNRLGMGGGFYDKTLSRLNGPCFHKPKLIGIAHSFQEVSQLFLESWDFPLDAVITEKHIFAKGNGA